MRRDTLVIENILLSSLITATNNLKNVLKISIQVRVLRDSYFGRFNFQNSLDLIYKTSLNGLTRQK